MKVIIYITLILPCTGQPSSACSQLHSAFSNKSDLVGKDCENLRVTHSESVSGGFCLASLTAAGYYRTGAVNPIIELISHLSGNYGNPPVITGSNSGGTMFIVRYFALRDIPIRNKWTYPCYLLSTTYRNVCFFHGNFGQISEECYSETQNLVAVASAMVYGGLMSNNGGPLGVVASYCSVYFSFLSNLPIPLDEAGFIRFWALRSHWNTDHQIASNWVAAFTLVNPLEASEGVNNYNFGFASYLSRGLDAHASVGWYTNMSVYTASSISANTLSGLSMMPFNFAGNDWDDSSDVTGMAPILKTLGLVVSYVMLKKLVSQHTVLVTRLASKCTGGCPVLDGGFTDNGPITPVLAAASVTNEDIRPRQVSLLGPSSTMGFIEYLLGIGANGFSAAGLNLCPFTQVAICLMLTTVRKLVIPVLPYEVGGEYTAISSRYNVFRPDQQVMKAFCADPLLFDHFRSMCEGDGLCHLYASALPGRATVVAFTTSLHYFVLSMIWLAPTHIASRFVEDYIPDKMMGIRYYSDMKLWFPDFVAVAPQKGGVGFTKVAGHSLLDYLTYLVQRLLSGQIYLRVMSARFWAGLLPPCGYDVFARAQTFTNNEQDQMRD